MGILHLCISGGFYLTCKDYVKLKGSVTWCSYSFFFFWGGGGGPFFWPTYFEYVTPDVYVYYNDIFWCVWADKWPYRHVLSHLSARHSACGAREDPHLERGAGQEAAAERLEQIFLKCLNPKGVVAGKLCIHNGLCASMHVWLTECKSVLCLKCVWMQHWKHAVVLGRKCNKMKLNRRFP